MFRRSEKLNSVSLSLACHSVGAMPPDSMNLSFAGCGFMGFYHIGVVACFREFAPEVLRNKVL